MAYSTTVSAPKIFPGPVDKGEFLAELGPDMERGRFEGLKFFCQEDSVLVCVCCAVDIVAAAEAATVAVVVVVVVVVSSRCCCSN